jgi:hypothetical protein
VAAGVLGGGWRGGGGEVGLAVVAGAKKVWARVKLAASKYNKSLMGKGLNAIMALRLLKVAVAKWPDMQKIHWLAILN